jgi:hypothetical protein
LPHCGADLLHAAGGERPSTGAESRNGTEQLHRLPFGRLHQYPAAAMPIQEGFWQAEVTKTIKVYGAPIDDAAVGKIVDYLAATY